MGKTLGGPATFTPPAPSHDRAVGWDELHPLAREHDLVAAFVDQAVVVVAEGDHLPQVGVPAVFPEVDVVGVGHPDRPVAAGPAQRDSSALLSAAPPAGSN